MTNTNLSSGLLVLAWLALVTPVAQAQDPAALQPTDGRFRLLEVLPENQTLPTRPENCKENVLFWRYFIGASTAPALMIATSVDSRQVWIDSDRDGLWQPVKPGPALIAQVQSNQKDATATAWPTPATTPVQFHCDHNTGVWRIASLAMLEGRLMLAGKEVMYVLRDENSDGRFEGADDLIRIDLNNNGQFENLRESFPLARGFRFQGKRYVVKLDRQTKQVGVEAIESTGQAVVTFDGWEALEHVPTKFHITLQSDSGIQAVINSLQPQELPVGNYQIYSASLDWDGDEKWRMTFERLDAAQSKSYEIKANETTSIPVLGSSGISGEIVSESQLDNQFHLRIQPMMKTDTGLYLTRASYGRTQATLDGMLVATAKSNDSRQTGTESPGDEKTLTTASTQFACGTFCPVDLKWKDLPATHVTLSFDSGPLAGMMTGKVNLKKEK